MCEQIFNVLKNNLANNNIGYGWKVLGNIDYMSNFDMQPSICHVWKTNGDI